MIRIVGKGWVFCYVNVLSRPLEIKVGVETENIIRILRAWDQNRIETIKLYKLKDTGEHLVSTRPPILGHVEFRKDRIIIG